MREKFLARLSRLGRLVLSRISSNLILPRGRPSRGEGLLTRLSRLRRLVLSEIF